MSAVVDTCMRLRTDSWCPGGPGGFRVDYASSGSLEGFLSGLLEYISPLNLWLDQLMGDESRVNSFAAAWDGAGGLFEAQQHEVEAIARSLADMSGLTIQALRADLDKIIQILSDTTQVAKSVAVALRHASEIVTNLHDALIGAIAELVRAGRSLLVPDLNGNPFDLSDEVHDFIEHARKFIHHIGDLLDAMFDAFDNLLNMLASLHPWIATAINTVRDMLSQLAVPVSILAGSELFGPVGGIVAGLFGGAASDLLAPKPTVTPLDPSKSADPEAIGKSDRTKIESVGQLVAQNGYTDDMGGADASVVDIKAVDDGHGGVTYIVSLPSTKDWGQLKGPMMDGSPWSDTYNDYGATNDLDSNVDLMLTPYAKTQYERALMDAMAQANIPPGANVVYTGFSQGGIMAANLASDANSPYNCVGVITNGSPIDTFDIDPDIPVLSFQHQNDIVQNLDGNFSGRTDANRTVVTLPGVGDGVMDAHDAEAYAASVEQYMQTHPGTDEQFQFLYGDVVDHQQFTWSE